VPSENKVNTVVKVKITIFGIFNFLCNFLKKQSCSYQLQIKKAHYGIVRNPYNCAILDPLICSFWPDMIRRVDHCTQKI
jgi:hypothetical protein